MFKEITPQQIPSSFFNEPFHHVIARSLMQAPRQNSQFFEGPEQRFAAYDPDLGFNYHNPNNQNIEAWAQFLCDQRIPLIAGELHSHYSLLQTMGQILPEDAPIQVMCRYEFQNFLYFKQQAKKPELPSTRLKRAQAKDIERLFQFYERSETMQARSKESLLHTIQNNRLFYLQKTGKIISAALTHCESKKAALIGGVYTPAHYRGKGYGAICMQALMSSLQSDDKVPCLFYEKNNQAAARLYQKLGFQAHGEWVVIELTYHNKSDTIE